MYLKLRKFHFWLILFFFLQTIWEPISVNYRALWCGDCYTESPITWFLLYNTGDINNSFTLCYFFIIIFRYICRMQGELPTILSSIIVSGIFLIIERDNLWDVPFAILGVVAFVIATLPHPNNRLQKL